MPITTHTITGNAGEPNALVSYSGTASGSVTADGSGNYTIGGLANGAYIISPSLSGFNFSPTSSNQTLSGVNITGVNFSGSPMTATVTAAIVSQPGSSVLTAWPQVTGQGVGNQNLDLLHIRAIGGQKLAVVQYNGTVLSGVQNALAVSAVAVSSFAATQITASTGVILGTFTGGAANAFAGNKVAILGFTTPGNNGTFTISASTATQITITPITGLADETDAATASVYGVSTATYNGTITNIVSAGSFVSVTGFVNASNNVTNAVVSSSTGSTIVVPFSGQIAETHVGAANVTVPFTNGTRVGVFLTRLTVGATLAALFADAFSNPSLLDILQVVNEGGTISYHLSYQGVATGS